MTKTTIYITRAAAGVYTVRDYITLMPLLGSADIDNFQAIKLASFDGSDPASKINFNDTSKFQVVDESYLRSIQFAEDVPFGTINNKMNWLINYGFDDPSSVDYRVYKRPYWKMSSGQLRFGTILFGQTRVKVETRGGVPVEFVRRGRYPGENPGDERDLIFYRVDGSRDWIVNATAIEGGIPTTTPRGTVIKHPIWSGYDNPANDGDGHNYIAFDFLEV